MISIFDIGFMGSILRSWIKHARVVKLSLLVSVSSIERSIVAKNVSINTTEGEVGSNINWLKKIQLLLRKVIYRGLKVKNFLLEAKAMMDYTIRLKGDSANLSCANFVRRLYPKYSSGQTKVENTKRYYQIGNVCV